MNNLNYNDFGFEIARVHNNGIWYLYFRVTSGLTDKTHNALYKSFKSQEEMEEFIDELKEGEVEFYWEDMAKELLAK